VGRRRGSTREESVIVVVGKGEVWDARTTKICS
jgi:hypothetical protein